MLSAVEEALSTHTNPKEDDCGHSINKQEKSPLDRNRPQSSIDGTGGDSSCSLQEETEEVMKRDGQFGKRVEYTERPGSNGIIISFWNLGQLWIGIVPTEMGGHSSTIVTNHFQSGRHGQQYLATNDSICRSSLLSYATSLGFGIYWNRR